MSDATRGAPLPSGAESVWRMYRAMVGIGLVCAILIVSVFVGTRPVIERNRAEALERAIFQVLPDARSSRTFLARDDGGFESASGEPSGAPRVYAGYDASGRLVGIAVEARGRGYQDVIAVLYGYDFERDAIVGLRVLESRETPGLGDKIESDPLFQKNFDELDVSLGPDAALAHPIEFVKHGEKEHPWQVDGITGATISSKAITAILRDSSNTWIPRLRAHLDDFRGSD